MSGALELIREQAPGCQILYIYLLDDGGRLAGVLPVRRLLTASADAILADLGIKKVIALPHTATVEEACDFFVLYRLLALPLVDDERRPVGVVTVDLLTDEILNVEQRESVDAIFETIGLRSGAMIQASAWQNFRFRFPWLGATLASGMFCALLVGLFEATLAESIILAFFLTLVLGLGESVCVQSLTVSIQTLRNRVPNVQSYLSSVRRELGVALLLGSASGAVVAVFILIWKAQLLAAAVIASSICLAILAACLIGLSIPTLFHRLRLDPKVASGPIALALADICTILVYFSLATLVL